RGDGRRRAEVSLSGSVVRGGPRQVGVLGVRLERGSGPAPGPVALVLQDVTEARRVEAVRPDFVANVGHELKNPVGAQPLPDLVPVDVDTVITEAVDRTTLAANAKQITIISGGEGGLVVRGVESQLATAVTNLLANAVSYSPENTRIAVGARARAGFGEITVTDSGIGIPREDRSRVFERFYRVDQSRASRTGGTGLGLAIVKHVATNHGGSVSVWSEEGLGSTFTLRKEGFEPVVATTGPEALAEFDRGGADIVLLDLMLPGLPGTEVCRQLRSRSSVPIIMLTAKDAEVDKVVGLELGADDYVTKPYSARELVARIRAVLRRRGDVEAPAESALEAGPVRMDVERHVVSVDGEPVALPLKEFDLLELLLRNAGRVLTRVQLIDRVWGSDYVGDTKTLDVHVKRLRGKI